MMRNLIIRFFINAVALWFASVVFSGFYFDTTSTLLISAIVFGILNAVIKPILLIFTLPINVLTLGLFTIIINAIILELASYWVDGFHLNGFITAVFSALIISLVSIVLNNFLGNDR
jgi:putative membrane protein